MKKHRILVVDDEQNVRNLIGKVLEKEGYDVSYAQNGSEGLAIFQDESIDLIISDIKMPEMSGIEFLHKVKSIEPDVGFILITAFATMETAIDAIKNGAQDYVTKPFDIEELSNAVKKILMSAERTARYSYDLQDTAESKTMSNSPAMQQVIHLAQKVATSDSTVLILGETGTGKEVLSTAMHNWSKRCNKPIIKVNCGAIPDNLLESELFGYEKGAFTGASASKPGRFEFADGGTIFLDEIGDLSPQLQVKLLRVLQERTFERLGGIRPITVDVRIIAATNVDLKGAVENGSFREDLYYRLNVVPITLPPLRERKEDIPHLINTFLNSASVISGDNIKTISPEAMTYLTNYHWPGNIRELENIIERCVVISEGSNINTDSLPPEILSSQSLSADCSNDNVINSSPLNGAIDAREKEVISRALRENGGNKTKTALALGISRRSLHRKIQKYDIV